MENYFLGLDKCTQSVYHTKHIKHIGNMELGTEEGVRDAQSYIEYAPAQFQKRTNVPL